MNWTQNLSLSLGNPLCVEDLDDATTLTEKVRDAAANFLRRWGKNQVRALESSSVRDGYWYGFAEILIEGLDRVGKFLSNQCSNQILGNDELRAVDNAAQLQLGDPFNQTGQRVMRLEEACCKCGGGTTRGEENPVIRAALVDFFGATGGKNWTALNRFFGTELYWNSSHHYCVSHLHHLIGLLRHSSDR